MLHNRSRNSDSDDDDDERELKATAGEPDEIENLIAADINRSALPQITDCMVNDGKW